MLGTTQLLCNFLLFFIAVPPVTPSRTVGGSLMLVATTMFARYTYIGLPSTNTLRYVNLTMAGWKQNRESRRQGGSSVRFALQLSKHLPELHSGREEALCCTNVFQMYYVFIRICDRVRVCGVRIKIVASIRTLISPPFHTDCAPSGRRKKPNAESPISLRKPLFSATFLLALMSTLK